MQSARGTLIIIEVNQVRRNLRLQRQSALRGARHGARRQVNETRRTSSPYSSQRIIFIHIDWVITDDPDGHKYITSSWRRRRRPVIADDDNSLLFHCDAYRDAALHCSHLCPPIVKICVISRLNAGDEVVTCQHRAYMHVTHDTQLWQQ